MAETEPEAPPVRARIGNTGQDGRRQPAMCLIHQPRGEELPINHLGRESPQVVHRRAEKRVAEVEETCPERRPVRGRVVHGCGSESLERTDEHGELEVDGGDAIRARAHPRPLENGTPLHELPRPGAGVPRPTFGALRLELEEVPGKRTLEPGNRRLDPVGGTPERRLARARRRRHGISPPPALEQPAERERCDLAGPKLVDEARRARMARRVPFDN